MLQIESSQEYGTISSSGMKKRLLKHPIKPRVPISSKPNSFNSLTITLKNGILSTSQTSQIAKYQIVETENSFASQRSLAQSIGINDRPDILAPIQLLDHGNSPTTTEKLKALGNTTSFLRKTPTWGRNFTTFEKSTTRMVIITDASISKTEEVRSKLGDMVLLTADSGA